MAQPTGLLDSTMPKENPFLGTGGSRNPISDMYGGVMKRAGNGDYEKGTDYSKDFSEDNALPGQRYYDKQVDENLVGGILSRGDDYYKNAEEYGLAGDTGQSFAADGGDPMAEAIAGRSKASYDDKVRGMLKQKEVNRPTEISGQLSRAGNMMGAEEQLKISNYKEQYAYQQQRQAMFAQWRNAKEGAKAQFLGSILGVGGSIAGAIGGKA
jgi:hypothetical protein